jgi:hypothetical protein
MVCKLSEERQLCIKTLLLQNMGFTRPGKAIPVTGLGGLYGCEMLRISHCLDNRLTVNCEILATCSSIYSPGSTLRLHKVKLSL